jgi:signal peptidase II
MADRWTGRLVLVVAVVATIGCDRVTKHVASTSLADSPASSYLGDTLRIGYVENTGGFLSLGAALPPGLRTVVFTAATGVVLLTLVAGAFRYRLNGWPAMGIALFVAGGASNWIDRVMHGAVVDFLNVGIGPLRTGVFNVADMAIMLGTAVLVLSQFRSRPTAVP